MDEGQRRQVPRMKVSTSFEKAEEQDPSSHRSTDIGAAPQLCGWPELPVEVGDIILCHAVQQDEHSHDKATAAVIPFVCRQWRDRKPFWQPLSSSSLSTKLSAAAQGEITSSAAGSGRLNVLQWLRFMG